MDFNPLLCLKLHTGLTKVKCSAQSPVDLAGWRNSGYSKFDDTDFPIMVISVYREPGLSVRYPKPNCSKVFNAASSNSTLNLYYEDLLKLFYRIRFVSSYKHHQRTDGNSFVIEKKYRCK